MKGVNLPEFRSDGCEYLAITVQAQLTDAEYRAFLEACGESDPGYLDGTFLGSGVSVSYTLWHHGVDEPEHGAPTDGEPGPPTEQAPSHLHLELRFYGVAEGAAGADSESSDEGMLSAAIGWLRKNKPTGTAEVAGGRRFSRRVFSPVVEIPDPPKPFTRTQSVTLVRESDEPTPGSPVYDLVILPESEEFRVLVTFRGLFPGTEDAIDRLYQQASDIASLGARTEIRDASTQA